MLTLIIAMRDKERCARNINNFSLALDSQPYLIAKVVKQPHIVVASDPSNAYTGISEFGQLTQEAHIAPGHDSAILVPIVEDVAHQEERGGIVLDVVKETHHPRLMGSAVGNVATT